jgi:hypothetical protein
MLDAVEEE